MKFDKMLTPPHKALVITLALFAVESVSADIVFPNADGSGDLSKASAWVPYNWDDAATNAVRFESKNQTYTITTNVTFHSVWMHAQKATNVFELAKDQKVTLTGSGLRMACDDWSKKDINSLTVFRGGTWDLSEKGSVSLCYTYWKSYRVSALFDNAVVTNAAGVGLIGYWVNNNHLVLTNNAAIYFKSPSFYTANSDHCSIEVTGGSRMLYQTGAAYLTGLSNKGSGSYHNLFLVSGEGSSVTGLASAVRAWESDCYDNVVRIEKGAAMKCPGAEFYVQGAGSHDNRLEVLDGGLLSVPRVYMKTGTANCILVSNATLRASDSVDFCGVSNRIEIVDGTLKLKNLNIGASDATARGNAFCIRGRKSSVEHSGTTYDFFSSACTGSLVEFDDVSFTSFSSIYNIYGTQNTLRIRNTPKFNLTYRDINISGTSNRVEVLDGSTVRMGGNNNPVFLRGRGCELMVSNATAKTVYEFFATNAVPGTVRLCGSHPLFETSKISYKTDSLIVRNDKTFRYELPTETNEIAACTNGTVFVNALGRATFDESTVFDIANIEEFQAGLRKTKRLKLVKGTSLDLPDTVLAAARATLPPRTSLDVELTTSKTPTPCALVLTVRPLPQGLTLIVR